MNSVLDELKDLRAKALHPTSVITVSVEVLDRAIAEIEHLRSVAGAVSQGESFSDMKAAAENKS